MAREIEKMLVVKVSWTLQISISLLNIEVHDCTLENKTKAEMLDYNEQQDIWQIKCSILARTPQARC